MNKKKHIVFILLSLFLSIITERAIPYSHVECAGVVVSDWKNKKDTPSQDADSKKLHSPFYQLYTFTHSINEKILYNILFFYYNQKIIVEPVIISDYNILFIVHIYSLKFSSLLLNKYICAY
ncbi:MAG: hypothetical protein IMY72_05090 [Bacteroidetes bacterium]|nr:hypothetical protein [Bacteroidota bacterium]